MWYEMKTNQSNTKCKQLALKFYLFCFKFKLNPKYELRILGIPTLVVDFGSWKTIFGFGDKLKALPLCTQSNNTNITEVKLNITRTAVMFGFFSLFLFEFRILNNFFFDCFFVSQEHSVFFFFSLALFKNTLKLLTSNFFPSLSTPITETI